MKMQQVQRDMPADSSLRSDFVAMETEGKLVDVRISAGVLTDLLAKNDFTNGAHIDIYDILPNTN